MSKKGRKAKSRGRRKATRARNAPARRRPIRNSKRRAPRGISVRQGDGPRPRRFVATGHLIDSGLMSRYLRLVVENGGSYDLHRFDIGRTVQDFSTAELTVRAPDMASLDRIVDNLIDLGCHPKDSVNSLIKPSDKNGTVPDDFYSTTNYRTVVRIVGREIDVDGQRMDACIVVRNGRAVCTTLRDVRRGDQVVCGHDGVEVFPPFKEREREDFVFMASDVSSEKRVELTVAEIARLMKEIKTERGRIVAVPGPVVVHTGGGEHLGKILRGGYVDAVLSGNALAVHDIERALYGTSLGVHLDTGIPVVEGHRNHMRAINTIRRSGSIAAAVGKGILRSGVMYECVKNRVPFVLAGSIRDDGPMPDTVMDLTRAQEEYAELLRDARVVLMLGTMLHSIGVGNMIPAWVQTICVDINPAVVTKLSDRGSAQTIGVVTDVGLFLRLLADELSAG